MNIEIEIKVKIENPIDAEKKISEVAKYIKTKKQIDKYFSPKNNDFFAQKPMINILRIRNQDKKARLEYHFANFSDNGKKISTEEYETEVENPEITEEILKRIGMELRFTISKIRKYYELPGFEIVLDNVEGLGDFIEVEAKQDFGGHEKTKQECLKLLKKLQIKCGEPIEIGYPEMMAEK